MDGAHVESTMTGPTQVSWGKWRGRNMSVVSSFATNVDGYQDIDNGRYR